MTSLSDGDGPSRFCLRLSAHLGTVLSFAEWSLEPQSAPRPGSPWRQENLRREYDRSVLGEDPVRAAQVDLVLPLAAGHEHLRALAWLMKSERAFPFAIPAAVRNCLEAYARAWWHLSAQTAEERVSRWVSSRAAMLRTQGGALREHDHAAARDLAKADALVTALADAGLRYRKQPDYTSLVVSVLDNGPKGADLLYWLLSGIAHAEPAGLGQMLMRVAPDSNDRESDPSLPDLVAIAQSDSMVAALLGYALLAHRRVLDAVAHGTGASQGAEVQAWRHQLGEALATVRNVLPNEPNF